MIIAPLIIHLEDNDPIHIRPSAAAPDHCAIEIGSGDAKVSILCTIDQAVALAENLAWEAACLLDETPCDDPGRCGVARHR